MLSEVVGQDGRSKIVKNEGEEKDEKLFLIKRFRVILPIVCKKK